MEDEDQIEEKLVMLIAWNLMVLHKIMRKETIRSNK